MISEDFQALLPKTARDKRPFLYHWAYDPDTQTVHIEDRGDHPSEFPVHKHMAKHITHPDRVDGFAIAVINGWRIFTDDLQKPDPFVIERVRRALEGEHPPKPLPHIRYHGVH